MWHCQYEIRIKKPVYISRTESVKKLKKNNKVKSSKWNMKRREKENFFSAKLRNQIIYIINTKAEFKTEEKIIWNKSCFKKLTVFAIWMSLTAG